MKEDANAWDRFWFAPEPTSTLALVRIALGIVLVGFSISLLPDLLAFYGTHGIVTAQPHYLEHGVWGLLGIFPGDGTVYIVWAALLLASIALLIGFWTRLAAVVALVGLIAFARRNPFVFNSGDALLRVLVVFVALAPAGASLSVDRWRRARDRFWEFPARAPWALRLIQVQMSVLYLSTVWQKVRGTTWNDGTAVSYAQRIADLERFAVPHAISDSQILANMMTLGTLAVETSLGILVWNRRARPWVLLIGVGLHLGIDLTIRVGFFSFAIFVTYLAWVSPHTASRLILAARDRRARGRRSTEPAGAPRAAEPVA